MRRSGALVASVLAATLSACGGGSSGTSSVPSSAQGARGTATATVTLKVPNASTPPASSSVRRAQFIGAAVAGVSLTFYLHSDTAHANPIGSGTFDVSSSSALCTPATGVRTCSLQETTLVGVEDLVVTTYDAPPVSGSFASAHELGTGTISGVTLSAGANTLAVAVGGTIATLALSPAVVLLPASQPASFALTYTAYDKAGEAIVAGANTVTNGTGNTETDTYANPITLAVNELGGTGHVLLSTGGSPTSSLQLTASNTPITVTYDGKASPGYSVTLAATATGATNADAALAIQFGPGLVVANANGASIALFPTLSSLCTSLAPCSLNEAPLTSLTTPAVPTSVALDTSGRVYTTNYAPANLVSVYNGTASPIETIAFGTSAYPQFVAVDSLGRIYVAVYNAGQIAVYPPVAASCSTAAPCSNPARIATITTLPGPYGIALDASNRLYAIDRSTGSLNVFAPLSAACTTASPCSIASNALVATLTTGEGYGSAAVDASGRSYFTQGTAIDVFAPVAASCSTSAPCTLATVGTISTAAVGNIALDASGNVFDSIGATNSIAVYPPLPSSCSTSTPCAVAGSPLETIGGSLTGLSGNQGIAVP